ncbi:MAG: hypothetical protein JNL74_10560 [Fibrobacteres bacterium]|nr:hypothetical protein [Fibrobacterota bacterium]
MAEFTGLPDFSFTEKDDDLAVRGVGIIKPDPDRSHEQDKKKRQPPPKEEAVAHFDELARAAERAHKILELTNSPYRFCIYRDGEEVFIDVVMLKPEGGASLVKKKNITHEEFLKLLRHVAEREGLFLDETA